MTAQQLKTQFSRWLFKASLCRRTRMTSPPAFCWNASVRRRSGSSKRRNQVRKNPSVIFKGADNTPYEKSAMKCGRWRMRYRLKSPIRGSGCGSLMSVSTSSVESHRSILQSKSTPLSPKSAINGAVFRLKRHSLLSRILCPPMGLSVFCRTTT